MPSSTGEAGAPGPDAGRVRGVLSPWLERLARPGAGRVCALLALVLAAPGVGTGLVVDDHVHLKFVRQQLAGAPEAAHVAWWDMFDIAGRAGGWDLIARIYSGVLPWWTSPELSMAFLRPLGVASHYLDYGLWPELPWLMRVHNLLGYGGLVLLVGLLSRRIMGVGLAAGLAVLMYAVDEAHAEGASWIASRNTMMTAVFVVLTLVLHDRARRDGSRAAAVLAPVSLVVALLCSEGGTAAFAYLVPYALFLDRGPVLSRALSLLPMFAVAGVWQAVYRKLGYGIYGSGLYRDPGDDLVHFLTALPERLPVVLRDQLVLPLMVFDDAPPTWHGVMNGAAIAAAVLLLGVLVPLLRRHPTMAFWAFGAVASAIPICAIGATPRLLFVTAVGAFGLLGELVARAHGAWQQPGGGTGRRALIGAALLFFVLHVPLAAALSPRASLRLVAYDELIQSASKSFPWGDDLAGKTLFVLNTPNYFVTTFAWAYVQGPPPKSAHILGASMHAVVVTRESEDTLVLAPEGGYMLEPWSTMVRRADEPFALGYRVRIADMWIEVIELEPDGRPRRIRCHLPRMGSGDFVWVHWHSPEARYRRTALPPVGGSFTIAAEADPSMRLDAPELP